MPRLRRSVLQSGAVATAIGQAGCLGFGGTNETIDVHFESESSTTNEITASVTLEEELLFEQTVTLEAGESTTRSFSNPDSTGSARVEAMLADGSPTTDSVRVGPGTGIRSLTIRISERKVIEIWAGRT
jgi:hypothetical protein